MLNVTDLSVSYGRASGLWFNRKTPAATVDNISFAIMPGEMDATVAELLPHCRLPRWHPYFTDIVAEDNSKAHGMEAICRHFGIRQEETLAFGDGANDIEMLEWAGIGVAMGNADDIVKKHADQITTDVDNEGIENAINQILQ